MNKKLRTEVKEKFGGRCAYTGKPLDDKWQVDHITPQVHYAWKIAEGDKNAIENLLPAMRIINHYKRSHTLESFRLYMSKFHLRLKKIPIKSAVQRTNERREYMMKVAELFDIAIDKPFTGKFYFENLC